MRNSFSSNAQRVLVYGVLWLGVVLMITPFIFMVATSLEATANINLPYPPRLIPKDFTLSNYVEVDKVDLY